MAHAAAWDPQAYHRFRDQRLRPALDLIARIPDPGPGGIADLGAGSGQVAAALRARFPDRVLSAIDNSPVMLEEAERTGFYDRLVLQDIADWQPEAPPALIFSNAALHWLPDHPRLFPRLVAMLAPGGVLAVQMPRQFAAPALMLLRQTAQSLFPDRFAQDRYKVPVAAPGEYARLLAGLGTLDIWETEYLQILPPAEDGHPVRHFTASTAARPFLQQLDAAETVAFWAAYDEVLGQAYPPDAEGGVIYPFRRLFIVLQRTG
ncbi:MAG: methyltransferase domain-containing protein [Alphaproteobacteria bacterium]|nr:MAG: methyltransferase domain-containing protein [Alphaproteobacteria bacterium]